MDFRLLTRLADPELLELPWQEPLSEWEHERLRHFERGIGRHVVRFVEVGGGYYALKELPLHHATREYRLLRELGKAGLPAVEAVGLVPERRARDGTELEPLVITRYLEYSLPFRLVLGRVSKASEASLVSSLSELLVRLHLAGFYWGDCSLSNTLFRRDAGQLQAYVVDMETGERHERLSPGQREHDIDLAEENLAGELLDLALEGAEDAEGAEGAEGAEDVDPVEEGVDVFALASAVRLGYEHLWSELNHEETFAAEETHRLGERLKRLNELGFDADEIEIESEDGVYRLRFSGRALSGHHRRRLLRLTGLDAQENQARRLLEDIDDFRVSLNAPTLSDAAVAGRWLSEVFEPAIAAVPAELGAKRAAAEVFHELLEHRWYLSEQAGRDVGLDEAIVSYVDDVLKSVPEERAILS